MDHLQGPGAPAPGAPIAHIVRLALLAASLALAGCGDEEDSSAATATPSTLSGTFHGPVGASVRLQVNGGDDLTVTLAARTGHTDAYDAQAFSFPSPLLNGSAYEVTLKDSPAGQVCSAFQGASGTAGSAAGSLHVGCEYAFDALARDGVLVDPSFGLETTPVVGGANVPIGAGTSAYGEGRYVAFVARPRAVAAGAAAQVYWRDRFTGTTYLVSANADGAEGDMDSAAPAISADGQTVVFHSEARNLVPADGNGRRDVFAWSALAPRGGVQRVSVGPGGVEADGDSHDASVSGDGRVVAFASTASNLADGAPVNGTEIVIRHDRATGVNTAASREGTGPAQQGLKPSISEDGNRVAFWSYRLETGSDTRGLWDIFVYDHGTHRLTAVSAGNYGGQRNQGSDEANSLFAPALSGNGRYVAYASGATNLVFDDHNNRRDVFVVDTQTGVTALASVAGSGSQGNADSMLAESDRPAISYDGTWVAFTTTSSNLGVPVSGPGRGLLLMHNTVTGETRAITSDAHCCVSGSPSMSRSGAYVVFSADGALDPRFSGTTGPFAAFTGLALPFPWWSPSPGMALDVRFPAAWPSGWAEGWRRPADLVSTNTGASR